MAKQKVRVATQQELTLETVKDGRISKREAATLIRESNQFPNGWTGPSRDHITRIVDTPEVRRYLHNENGRLKITTTRRRP